MEVVHMGSPKKQYGISNKSRYYLLMMGTFRLERFAAQAKEYKKLPNDLGVAPETEF